MPRNGRKVGVIGSGPAGLSVAFELARLGYTVEIHEAEEFPGGILTYGIPSYRLSPEIVQDEIDYVKAAGVEVLTNSRIDDLTLFLEQFDAVFIGVGAYHPHNLDIDGERLEGVYQAVDYLRDRKLSHRLGRHSLIRLGRDVIVIGGGNTAIDAAMSAKFSRCEVTIFYRRSANDMPAFRSEIDSARKLGVKFMFNYWPKEFRMIEGMFEATFFRTEPGPVDKSGRPRPILIESSEEVFRADNILIAVGQGPSFKNGKPIKTNEHGLIVVDEETGAASTPGIFAGGDAVNGGATAVQAVAEGKRAARGIDKYLKSQRQGVTS
jgi:NADPH-dependent glutamate synthase beta subunit-like oxidoreductase